MRKFPEATGKGKNPAGHDASSSQWQADREEGGGAACPEGSGGHFQTRIDRLESQADRADHQRKTHDRGRQRRGPPREYDFDAKPALQDGTDWTAGRKKDQQQIPGYHGRQHQGEVGDDLDQPLAAEPSARQPIPHSDGQWKSRRRGAHRHLEAQSQRRPLFRSHGSYPPDLPAVLVSTKMANPYFRNTSSDCGEQRNL